MMFSSSLSFFLYFCKGVAAQSSGVSDLCVQEDEARGGFALEEAEGRVEVPSVGLGLGSGLFNIMGSLVLPIRCPHTGDKPICLPKDPRLHPFHMLSPAELLLPSLNLSGSDTRYFFS